MQAIECNGDWIQTYRHHKFYPLSPRIEDIDIEDIAHALSCICRFTGHTKEFYSVAQHSVAVSHFCDEEDALWGLLHDASEAYLSDISRPFKHSKEMDGYRSIERGVMNAICDKFHLKPYDIPPNVKLADARMLQTEARDLMYPLIDDWKIADPYDHHVIPVHPRVAEAVFIERFKYLTKGK
jgi:hypothetical protein